MHTLSSLEWLGALALISALGGAAWWSYGYMNRGIDRALEACVKEFARSLRKK